MTSGPVVAMELSKADAVKQWRKLLGPTDSIKAKVESPESIRAKFGKDKTNNAAHGSDSSESAKRVSQGKTRLMMLHSKLFGFTF